MNTKVCTKCEKEQNISSFYKEKRYKDGYKSICKSCLIQSTKAWKESNPSKVIEQKNRYYQNNLIKEKIRNKNYRLNNKEIINSLKRKRRALQLGNECIPYTLDQVIDTYGIQCYVCGNLIDLKAERQPGKDGWQNGLHIDHYVPLSKGGADILENVRPTHGLCNLKKGSKIL